MNRDNINNEYQVSPVIAIVVPCYNSEAWIGRTIDSVLAQDYPDLVLIAVDDGSTDASLRIMQGYGDRIIVETGPNRGACHARNRGTHIARAKGVSHILYLDADDYLEGLMLAGAGRIAMETDADIVLSGNPLEYPDGQRKIRGNYAGIDEPLSPKMVFDRWMRGDYFNPSAILWKLSFVERLGGWNESLSRAQDTDFSLRAMLLEPEIRWNSQGVAIYSKSNPGSISNIDSEPALDSRLRVFSNLAKQVRGTGFEPIAPLLAGTIYSVTRRAFVAKHHGLGRRGVAELDQLDFRSHPGSRMHRLLCRFLGLETKVRLWGN